MKTTTMQHLGHAAGRARRVAPPVWRPAAGGFRGLGTTGVDVTKPPVSACESSSYDNPANTNDTITGFARHLGARVT